MTPSPPKLNSAFQEHLSGEDDLGVVIRAHIYIEAGIIQYVESAVPHPSELPRLTYEARLRLARALGFRSDHFNALKLLGDIRNSFGHKLEASLSDQKVNELFSKLPDGTQTLVKPMFQSEIEKIGRGTPRAKFVVMAIVLYALVEAEVHNIKNAQQGAQRGDFAVR